MSRDVVGGMAPMTGDRFFDDMEPQRSVDFWVADTDAVAEKAAALDGKIISPPTDGPVARQAVLADSQGAVFTVSRVLV